MHTARSPLDSPRLASWTAVDDEVEAWAMAYPTEHCEACAMRELRIVELKTEVRGLVALAKLVTRALGEAADLYHSPMIIQCVNEEAALAVNELRLKAGRVQTMLEIRYGNE
jgi:hypothetical protein